jgi:hypothetical protein
MVASYPEIITSFFNAALVYFPRIDHGVLRSTVFRDSRALVAYDSPSFLSRVELVR